MRILEFSALCFAIVVFPGSTIAADYPLYITGVAGGLFREDATRFVPVVNRAGVPGNAINTVTTAPGFQFSLGLGRQISKSFRLEADISYSHYSADTESPRVIFDYPNIIKFQRLIKLPLVSGGGRDAYAASLNGFLDVPVGSRLAPFVGGGAGIKDTVAANAHYGFDGLPVSTIAGGRITRPMVAGEAGLTILLNKQWRVAPSYRFEHVFVINNAFRDDEDIFKLGFRRTF